MTDSDTRALRTTTLRVETKVLDMAKLTARSFGRSLNAELRLALLGHVHVALLALLNDPSSRKDPELQAFLEQNPDFEATVKKTLEDLYSTAFDRRVPSQLLEQFQQAA